MLRLFSTDSVVLAPMISTPVPASPMLRLSDRSSRLAAPSMSITPEEPVPRPISPSVPDSVAPLAIEMSAMPAPPTVSWVASVTLLPVPESDRLPTPPALLPSVSAVALTEPPADTFSAPAARSPTISVPPMLQVEAGPVTVADEPSVDAEAAMSANGPSTRLSGSATITVPPAVILSTPGPVLLVPISI